MSTVKGTLDQRGGLIRFRRDSKLRRWFWFNLEEFSWRTGWICRVSQMFSGRMSIFLLLFASGSVPLQRVCKTSSDCTFKPEKVAFNVGGGKKTITSFLL